MVGCWKISIFLDLGKALQLRDIEGWHLHILCDLVNRGLVCFLLAV